MARTAGAKALRCEFAWCVGERDSKKVVGEWKRDYRVGCAQDAQIYPQNWKNKVSKVG